MRWSKKIVNKYLNVLIIIFFQFFGTALFGYININLLNKMHATSSAAYKEVYTSIDFAFSLFICISYGRQFSGGLYNPAITMFRMLRKNERIPVKTGLLYIFMQFLGSTSGCCFAFWANDLNYATIATVIPASQQLRRFYVEIMGTGVFAVMLQTIVQKKTTFIEHNRQFYLCIPLFFMITRQYSAISNGMNPALGFGYQFAFCIFRGQWQVLPLSYILIIGPFIGAFLAVMLFEYVLKPLYPLKRDELVKQIQKIQLTRRSMRQTSITQASLITVRDLSFAQHKYNFGQVMNIQPENQVYTKPEQTFEMIDENSAHNEVKSIEDEEQLKIRVDSDFDQNLSFRVVTKFNY